ncbi:T9SS type A sorting domain-containing protein [Mariniflexile sp. HNIBRBA6329]|uniref:CBM96 family carbohydrate-binding protein n=1 Tax=Mariniflexile sp. HNIBRBA6329 TaxID=3373088 RepID=UPI0037469814
MKKLITLFVAGLLSPMFYAQTTTVTKQNTLIKSNHNFGLTNPVVNEGSPMTYNPSEVDTKGAAFSINYTNQGGTSFDGYPSGTVGGFKAGGTYYSGNVNACGMPVQISNLTNALRINWKTSQANADDLDDKWWATINVIFDSGDRDSIPNPEARDYDLVIQNVSYEQDDLSDFINPGGRYWYFARETPGGAIKPFTIYLNGDAYSFAVRYKFFDYPSEHPDYDKNDKVHIKFIPMDNSTPIPYLDHSLKQFIDCTVNYLDYLPLNTDERILADEKVAESTLWIKSISAGYEVYEGASTLANDFFYTTIDTTAPVALTNLIVTEQLGEAVLTWEASTDVAFDSYSVYRSDNGGTYNLIASEVRENNYTDATISTGIYNYYVTATDRSFNESAPSNIQVLDLGGATPNAPTDVLAVSNSCTSVDLTWTDNSDNEDGFNILQSTNGGNYTLVQALEANIQSFSITNLSESTSYTFIVNAVNTYGTSDDVTSNVISTNACPVYYSLIVNAINGLVSPSNGSYLEGSNISLHATPNAGYEFSHWSGDATGSDNPLSLLMNGNKVVTANFTEIPTNSTTTISVVEDSHVRAGAYKNDNFGSFNSVQIKQSNVNDETRIGYLKFNLSGVSNIISAVLRVNNTGGNGSVDVKTVSADNWSESSIKWNGRPSEGNVIGTYNFNGLGTYDIDVTSYVVAESQGNGIASFVLKGLTSDYITISSKEGGVGASLIIEYNNGGSQKISKSKLQATQVDSELSTNKTVLYPNPVKSVLNINMENADIEKGTIEIFDSIGKLVKKVAVTSARMNMNLDLPTGMYLVKIQNKGVIEVKRIVKQ